MRVFVIGATGFVGGHLARHLVTVGHEVRGLARTDAAATRLAADGILAVRGDLEQRRGAALAAAVGSDVVVFAAQPEPAAEADAVSSLLAALRDTDTTFVFVSGSGVLLQRTAGAWSDDSFAEDDHFTVEPLAATRRHVEEMVRGATDQRLRTMVIRPGMIWGPGDRGHLAMAYTSVARTGAACYVGVGLNTYGHVHVDDVGRLLDAALVQGRPGALYHAVAGETPTRWIAESVAADAGVGTRSLGGDDAVDVFSTPPSCRAGPVGSTTPSRRTRLAPAPHRHVGRRRRRPAPGTRRAPRVVTVVPPGVVTTPARPFSAG